MNNLSEAVQYRLERAEEAYHDALTLAESGGWNSCVNRLYYSCFYAVSALLLQDNLSSSKHTGVRGIFNKDYVTILGTNWDRDRAVRAKFLEIRV